MSGVGIKAEIRNLDAIDDKVVSMLAAAGDLTAVMDDIGASLVVSTQDRFERGETPAGQPWEPSQRVIQHGGQTLIDHSHLVSSMTHNPFRDSVEAGTNMVYAAIQNFGGQAGVAGAATIPAREFMGFDAEDEAMIMEKLTGYLSEVMQ